MVVDTGIEPVTPSMSRKCATAAPIDRGETFNTLRWRRDLNPWFYSFAGCCFGPLSHSTNSADLSVNCMGLTPAASG